MAYPTYEPTWTPTSRNMRGSMSEGEDPKTSMYILIVVLSVFMVFLILLLCVWFRNRSIRRAQLQEQLEEYRMRSSRKSKATRTHSSKKRLSGSHQNQGPSLPLSGQNPMMSRQAQKRLSQGSSNTDIRDSIADSISNYSPFQSSHQIESDGSESLQSEGIELKRYPTSTVDVIPTSIDGPMPQRL